MVEMTYKANGSTVRISVDGLVELPMLGDILGDLIGNMSRDVTSEQICTAVKAGMDRWGIEE